MDHFSIKKQGNNIFDRYVVSEQVRRLFEPFIQSIYTTSLKCKTDNKRPIITNFYKNYAKKILYHFLDYNPPQWDNPSRCFSKIKTSVKQKALFFKDLYLSLNPGKSIVEKAKDIKIIEDKLRFSNNFQSKEFYYFVNLFKNEYYRKLYYLKDIMWNKLNQKIIRGDYALYIKHYLGLMQVEQRLQ